MSRSCLNQIAATSYNHGADRVVLFDVCQQVGTGADKSIRKITTKPDSGVGLVHFHPNHFYYPPN